MLDTVDIYDMIHLSTTESQNERGFKMAGFDSRVSVEEVYDDQYADDRDLLLLAADDVLLYLEHSSLEGYFQAMQEEGEYNSPEYERMVEDWTDKNRED